MRKWIFAAALSLGATQVHASPGVMFGISYSLGNGLGLSVKALSSDRENRTVASAGASYYPRNNRVGIDFGVGRTFDSGAATVSWDILNNSPMFGVGYVDTRR